jgi:hypothetical protein
VKATNFEFRHQTLLRQLLIAAALTTYLFDPDDIVWRFVKESRSRTALEHGLFLIATLMICAGATLCTRAAAASQPQPEQYIGELLFAIGLGSLFPLSGFVLLVAGETIRILRLSRSQLSSGQLSPGKDKPPEREIPVPEWRRAFREQSAKWGIFISMIVFSITLRDRVAEILVCASVLVWALLNLPQFTMQRT